MSNRLLAAIACIAGSAAGTAVAQPAGTATYSFAFGTPGGPSSTFLIPGQSTTVYVKVAFTPGIGQPIGNPPGAVAGLSDGAFSITGTSGSWSQASLALQAPYNFPFGCTQGAAAGSNVNGALWGIGFLLQLPHPSPNNPDVVWSGEFTMGAQASVTLSFTGLGPTGVFYGGPIPSVALYNSVGTLGIINIPAPGAAALLAFAGLATARRSRLARAQGVTP